MSIKWMCGFLLLAGLALATERGEEIRLWPNGAPGSEGVTAPEVSQPSDNPKLPKRFTVVH
ncbi:MAG: alpha/beta hydrolase, partial [Bryobacteraceae bacterium]